MLVFINWFVKGQHCECEQHKEQPFQQRCVWKIDCVVWTKVKQHWQDSWFFFILQQFLTYSIKHNSIMICDPCILSAVSALPVIRVEFWGFQSRWWIERLRGWCHAWQRIQKLPVWQSHFVPVSVTSVRHRGKWFLWFFGWVRQIHYQAWTVQHSDVVVFFIYLNWAAAVLCISYRIIITIMCSFLCHFSFGAQGPFVTWNKISNEK